MYNLLRNRKFINNNFSNVTSNSDIVVYLRTFAARIFNHRTSFPSLIRIYNLLCLSKPGIDNKLIKILLIDKLFMRDRAY